MGRNYLEHALNHIIHVINIYIFIFLKGYLNFCINHRSDDMIYMIQKIHISLNRIHNKLTIVYTNTRDCIHKSLILKDILSFEVFVNRVSYFQIVKYGTPFFI